MTAVAIPAPRRAPAPRPATRREERERHLRVVPAHQRRIRLIVLLGVALTVGALFGLVALNSELAQGQFQISRLEQRLQEQQLRNERLRFDVARLASPDAIVKAAQAQGLVDPGSIDYVVAPATVPRAVDADPTSQTLADTYAKSKSSLAPEP
jgi:cell division protein FtsL